jgi:propionyl-CoA carboxylase alpha chain
MIRAIDEYEITGLETTLGFCRFVMEHDAFRSGNFDTRFIENYFKPDEFKTLNESDEWIAAALATTLMNGNAAPKNRENGSAAPSKWSNRKYESY